MNHIYYNNILDGKVLCTPTVDIQSIAGHSYLLAHFFFNYKKIHCNCLKTVIIMVSVFLNLNIYITNKIIFACLHKQVPTLKV